MNGRLSLVMTCLGVGLVAGAPSRAADVGTAFTYQGFLEKPAGTPVTGTCNFVFRLWDDGAGGVERGKSPQTVNGVSVVNGVFTVGPPDIDFGPEGFDGTGRWLTIDVQCPGDVAYVQLSPRVELTPAPHALALPGLYTQQNATSPNIVGGFSGNTVVTPGNFGPTVGATISGGGNASDLNQVSESYATVGGGRGNHADGFSSTVGGGQTNAASSYSTVGGGAYNTGSGFGSTVDGGIDNTASETYSTVGGGFNNTASSGFSTVGGGADNTASGGFSTVGGGRNNTASLDNSTVGGGDQNTASGVYSTVGGGFRNTASVGNSTVGGGLGNLASLDNSTVGGGQANTASGNGSAVGGGLLNHADGYSSTVGGGYINIASNEYSTVGGGVFNTASGQHSTIGGGNTNTASGTHATVGGGQGNTASEGGYSTVGGGIFNTADGEGAMIGGGQLNAASGQFATVAGGLLNGASGDKSVVGGGVKNFALATDSTVAGGNGNGASGDGAAVGGGVGNAANGVDSTVGGGTGNTASGQVSTIGGGTFSTASGDYSTVPGGNRNSAGGEGSFAAGTRAVVRDGNPASVYYSGDSNGDEGALILADSTFADLISTGPNQFLVRASGGTKFYSNAAATIGVQLPAGGNSWSAISDRNVKQNVAPVDSRDVLERLAGIPIGEWNLISQDPSIRHIGPMAQDFHAAFGVGEMETHISSSDADGVALAAIQGLYEIVQEKDCEIEALRSEIEGLKELVKALAAQSAGGER